MKWFRHKPASSEKSQDDPPPYDDNPLSPGEKISPSNSVNTVASGPPIISGKKRNYWVDWSEQPSRKNLNPGLLGVWPYEPRLQRDHGLLFGATASWKKIASLHPGEMELTIHPHRDWTKHWAWAILIRVHIDPYPSTYCDLKILVKDLPAQLLEKEVCWKTTNWKSEYDLLQRRKEISQKEDFYMHYLAFSTPEPLEEKPLHLRSWVAEVAVSHKDKEWLKDHDFRDALSPENIVM
ncbi:hypothetical protein CEP54_011810 [Fusarium duplospermum]|uniref:Uncharacterized protein n=1 Tax=Fusarium duplospermum TaxID=1325734 RepID=A0A428PCE5_9HYPO|nr:hypothetical protein CEP54_011810 [Fusarium duplospermum]